MQPQVKTPFSLPVYPHGKGWGEKGEPAKLYFPDKETKDKYVSQEYKFCAAEYIAFNGATSKTEREEARIELLKKRSLFAQKWGFGPSMKDNKMWFYKTQPDTIIG